MQMNTNDSFLNVRTILLVHFALAKDALNWTEWCDMQLVIEAILTKLPWIRAAAWMRAKKETKKK